jgi:hypothetical protein
MKKDMKSFSTVFSGVFWSVVLIIAHGTITSSIAATPDSSAPDRPFDINICASYYQKYEPAFYTGFAPRSRDTNRLHLHVGRGNQLRATLVLSDEVLENYARDILTRYTTYKEMIDSGTITLTQNSSFEDFAQTINDLNIEELAAAESAMEPSAIRERNLQLLERLNPKRIFHISIPVEKLIDNWLSRLKPDDFKKIERKRQLLIINRLLPTRLWLTSLDKDTSKELTELIHLAGSLDNLEKRRKLKKHYMALLDRISHGIYSHSNGNYKFVEFTSIYPIGTFNEYNTCDGQKVPLYPTPGKWTLTTHQRTKTVDHIPEIPIYSYFPWIPYMHVGSKLHNSFHTLWWKMEVQKTEFLPEELRNPQLTSREGKKYRYLWLLSRGPMSHGCTHVNGGHILELRQLLPAETEQVYNVVFFLNKSCLFDVFDIDGDLTPEVMGVRYFVAYSLHNKKPGKLRAPMERRPFYKWLYGNALQYEDDGRGYFSDIRDGHFVDKLAVNGERYSKAHLYEMEFEPFKLQFFAMKDIPFVRELRKTGEDHPIQ